jgi:hypothetical protein
VSIGYGQSLIINEANEWQRATNYSAVFLDVVPCGHYESQRFGQICSLHLKGRKPESEERC